MSNGLFFLYLFCGTIFTLLYVVFPIFISFVFRITVEPDVEMIDPANYPIPEALRERLERDRPQILAAGFQPLAAFIVHGFGQNVECLNYIFLNREASRILAVGATLIVSSQNRSFRSIETRISSSYHASPKMKLSVATTTVTGPFFISDDELSVVFPQVNDISRLIELFDLLEQRHFFGISKNLILDTKFSGNVELWAKSQVSQFLQTAFQHGFFRRRPGEDVYRYPLRAVYRSLWHSWWPMKLVPRQLLIRRGKRLERELIEGLNAHKRY